MPAQAGENRLAVNLDAVSARVGAHAHFGYNATVYAHPTCRYHFLGGAARGDACVGKYLLQTLTTI